MGWAVFYKPPASQQMRQFLGRTLRSAGATPKYLICDKGCQFWCARFKEWCDTRGIRPRFGAIGQYGSLAVLERFIRTLKDECTRRLPLVPLSGRKFRRELELFGYWYNGSRPHMSLGGRTPNEVYHSLRPANRRPRFEPRPGWPRGSPCAVPQVLVNVNVADKRPVEDLPEFQKHLRAVEAALGGDGRVLVRYSGTEPKARVMVEGDDEARVRSYAQELASALQRSLAGAA